MHWSPPYLHRHWGAFLEGRHLVLGLSFQLSDGFVANPLGQMLVQCWWKLDNGSLFLSGGLKGHNSYYGWEASWGNNLNCTNQSCVWLKNSEVQAGTHRSIEGDSLNMSQSVLPVRRHWLNDWICEWISDFPGLWGPSHLKRGCRKCVFWNGLNLAQFTNILHNSVVTIALSTFISRPDVSNKNLDSNAAYQPQRKFNFNEV